MKLVSLCTALVMFVAPIAAHATELSDSPQFRYRSHRTRGIERPSHRSVERNTRAYRAEMAANRRQFSNQLDRIEAARDAVRNEYYRAESPAFVTDQQGFVPFHTYRFRRSVRHFHWNSLYQETPEADIGQGHAADEE